MRTLDWSFGNTILRTSKERSDYKYTIFVRTNFRITSREGEGLALKA